MTTIRPDNASISGVWARDLSGVAFPEQRAAQVSQAFSDFSAFAGDDVRLTSGGRMEADAAVQDIAARLTEVRDNSFL